MLLHLVETGKIPIHSLRVLERRAHREPSAHAHAKGQEYFDAVRYTVDQSEQREGCYGRRDVFGRRAGGDRHG